MNPDCVFLAACLVSEITMSFSQTEASSDLEEFFSAMQTTPCCYFPFLNQRKYTQTYLQVSVSSLRPCPYYNRIVLLRTIQSNFLQSWHTLYFWEKQGNLPASSWQPFATHKRSGLQKQDGHIQGERVGKGPPKWEKAGVISLYSPTIP